VGEEGAGWEEAGEEDVVDGGGGGRKIGGGEEVQLGGSCHRASRGKCLCRGMFHRHSSPIKPTATSSARLRRGENERQTDTTMS